MSEFFDQMTTEYGASKCKTGVCGHCDDCRVASAGAGDPTPAETPLKETPHCPHCNTQEVCLCEWMIEKYGATHCVACGYSYECVRGEVAASNDENAPYLEQYGCHIREPCSACSPAFKARLIYTQTMDLYDYEEKLMDKMRD